MPNGIQPISNSELSAGGRCPGDECTPGELATWRLGNLRAGESATVSFVPVAAPSIEDGKFLLNPRNGYKYPIRNGIPVMLIEEGKKYQDKSLVRSNGSGTESEAATEDEEAA